MSVSCPGTFITQIISSLCAFLHKSMRTLLPPKAAKTSSELDSEVSSNIPVGIVIILSDPSLEASISAHKPFFCP